MPVETDFAWASGFLDGEGYFGAVVRKTTRGVSYNPIVSASQTCVAPLERLQQILGGGVCESKKKHRPGESRIYKWDICSAVRLREVLPFLIPHMTVKREEAETLLSLCMLIQPVGMGRYHVGCLNVARRRALAARLIEIRRLRKLKAMP